MTLTRGGAKKRTQEPERRCIATGKSGGKAGLIRFVAGPDGTIYPDLAEKLPGRGIWVTAKRSLIERATKKGLFSRAAKQRVEVPSDLADRVEAGLVNRLTETIALARKAGKAVCGREKVKTGLDAGGFALLLQARDGSEREKRNLRAPAGENSRIEVLDSAELGLAFGRDNVIHAAIAPGGFVDRVAETANKLAGLRLVAPPDNGAGERPVGQSAGRREVKRKHDG